MFRRSRSPTDSEVEVAAFELLPSAEQQQLQLPRAHPPTDLDSLRDGAERAGCG